MQALKTMLWVFFAVCIAIFAYENRTSTDITIPTFVAEDIRLSIRVYWLAIVSFLAGSLPLWLLYRATKWRLERRLETSERSLADLRAVHAAHSAAAAGTASAAAESETPPAQLLQP